jgi:ornithine cyclodeaminase/alanine dehydrogenase-like protein (mu-crystallin family)
VIATTSLDQFYHDEGADIFDGLRDGVFPEERLVDLGQLLQGEHPGRTSDDQITVYKNSAFYGTADQALTRVLIEKGREHGLGQQLALADTTLVNR